MKPVLLIIDDEKEVLSSLQRGIRRLSISDKLKIETAAGGQEGLRQIKTLKPEIILTDMKMPGIDGLEIISKTVNQNSHVYVIVMTGYTDVKEAVILLKKGIYDYIAKPFEIEELEAILQKILHELTLENKIIELQNRITSAPPSVKKMISNNSKIKEIEKTIYSVRDTDFNVLILGESGTGKELAADLIHYSCLRRNGPFIKVNCAGLVPSLLESEMFGHEKGSFTGAIKTKEGKFSLANGGTLFLDEIGDMDISLQAKLLRTIQDGVFQKVGGVESCHTDARIIAATNRNLSEYIEKGKFRQDLYYRLNVVSIKLPPLRDRKEDIPLLAMYFLKNLSQKYDKNVTGINPDAIDILEHYSFPGNIRELENIITRSFVTASGASILKTDLPPELMIERVIDDNSDPIGSDQTDLRLKPLIEDVEKKHIRKVLALSGYNRTRASELLGLSRRQLYYKLNEHELL